MGPARTGGGTLRLRLARRPHRTPARERCGRRPGHPHRLPTALVHPGSPGRIDSRARRHPTRPRQPGHVLPHRTRLPERGPSDRRGARRTLRRPSRPRAVARAQRVRHPLLLRPHGCRLPGVAARPPRLARRPQRGLGNGLLEPALHLLGTGTAAACDELAQEPRPASGLPPLLGRRGHRRLPRAARRDPRAQRPAGDDQPDAALVPEPRSVGPRPGTRRGHLRPVPHLARPGRRRRRRLPRGSRPIAGRRPSLAADGAGHQHRLRRRPGPRQGPR